MATQFELDIARFVAAAKGDLTLVARRVALDMFKRVINKSPVGNPEIWAANSATLSARAAAIDEAAAKGKKVSQRTLEKKFPLITGKGYVGGRFKSSWVVGINSIPTEDPGTIDKNAALARVQAAVPLMKLGDQITLVSNLTYANRLEFGHSSQAPSGMVRLTAMEFGAVTKAAEAGVPNK